MQERARGAAAREIRTTDLLIETRRPGQEGYYRVMAVLRGAGSQDGKAASDKVVLGSLAGRGDIQRSKQYLERMLRREDGTWKLMR